MQRRHSKITVLIVPAENVEPISFRFRKGLVKFFYVVGLVLLAHIVIGGIFYWKYAKLLKQNEELVVFNDRLKEDNKRVIEVAEDFYALERKYKRVKSLLGVESDTPEERGGRIESREVAVLSDRIVPVASTDATLGTPVATQTQSVFLKPNKALLGDYPESMPTFLPIKGFVTSDFEQSGWFARQNHSGLDIVAKKGSVIRAAGSGVIIFANWTFDLGNLVIIDHGGGLVSYYGHTQRMLKPERSYVQKGDIIALVGSSGNSSGPHLHFEIRKDGIPVDPKRYVVLDETIRTGQVE